MNDQPPSTIPTFTSGGLLPDGLHPCSMQEIDDRFGRFRGSDRRIRLTKRLADYLSELRNTGFVSRVVVDGSYVTDKDEPEDIDLIVVLRSDCDFSVDLTPVDYNAISKRQVVKKYGFDVMVVPEDSPALYEHISFFQRTKDGRTKGLLQVQP